MAPLCGSKGHRWQPYFRYAERHSKKGVLAFAAFEAVRWTIGEPHFGQSLPPVFRWGKAGDPRPTRIAIGSFCGVQYLTHGLVFRPAIFSSCVHENDGPQEVFFVLQVIDILYVFGYV